MSPSFDRNKRHVVMLSMLSLLAPGAFAMRPAATLAHQAPVAKATEEKESEADIKKREATLQKRLADRVHLITKIKAEEKIGETWTGTLAARNDADLDDKIEIDASKGTKVSLREFLKMENDDREAIYTILANRRSTEDVIVTADAVGVQSGIELAKRASPGDWLLTKSGKWVKKPEVPRAGGGR